MELIILICLAALAFILHVKFKDIVYHSQKERVFVSVIILVLMIGWEHYSVTHDLWLYPGPGLIGIFIWRLPIELYLFYIILPYFVFTVFDIVHRVEDKTKK